MIWPRCDNCRAELDNWRSVLWSPSPHQAVRVFRADHVNTSAEIHVTRVWHVSRVSRVRGTCVPWTWIQTVSDLTPGQWTRRCPVLACSAPHFTLSLLSPHTKFELRLWLRFLTGQIYTSQGSANTRNFYVLIPSWQKFIMSLMIPLSAAGKIF